MMSGLNSISKYGHEAVRLDRARERATPERTAPESDKKERTANIRVDLLERGEEEFAPVERWICWSSERKNSRPFKTHLSRLGERHLVAGVLWFSARLVAGVVCVWLPWFLLGRLVLREGADVEPCGAAR